MIPFEKQTNTSPIYNRTVSCVCVESFIHKSPHGQIRALILKSELNRLNLARSKSNAMRNVNYS